MPLRDHFHPPLLNLMGWASFHSDWITMMVQRLNTVQLSEKYFARGTSHIGSEVEIDIATLEEIAFNGSSRHRQAQESGAVATAPKTYSPPRAAIDDEVEFAEEELFEVQILSENRGQKLVAAIELVSEANKDRPATRRTFAMKVGSYLAKGVCVVVVDVVTNRLANMHAELVELLRLPNQFEWESATNLSAITYRMIQIGENPHLQMWPHVLNLGEELPTLPLWLAADVVVPLELNYTYAEACAGLRIR